MRKLGNPCRECCDHGCDHNPPIAICQYAFECCSSASRTVTFTFTLNGVAAGSCSATGTSCTVAFTLPPGTVLDWSASSPGLPTRSGQITLADCGVAVNVAAFWFLTDFIPAVLHATVNGPTGNVGEGTWSGPLTYDGNPIVTPSGTYYTWDSGCLGGIGWGYRTVPLIAWEHGRTGDCSVNIFFDIHPFPHYTTEYTDRIYYGSTRATLTIFVPPLDVHQCRITFEWKNFAAGGCPAGEDTPNVFYAIHGDGTNNACSHHAAASYPAFLYHAPCGISDCTFLQPDYATARPQTTEIIPQCAYQTYRLPTPGATWDLFDADANLAASCAPVDWSGPAPGGTVCGETPATVHITS